MTVQNKQYKKHIRCSYWHIKEKKVKISKAGIHITFSYHMHTRGLKTKWWSSWPAADTQTTNTKQQPMVSDSSQTQYFDFCYDGTDHITSYPIILLHITFPILSHFKVLWIRADIFKNISGQKENVPFPLLSYFSQGLCSYAFTWFCQRTSCHVGLSGPSRRGDLAAGGEFCSWSSF